MKKNPPEGVLHLQPTVWHIRVTCWGFWPWPPTPPLGWRILLWIWSSKVSLQAKGSSRHAPSCQLCLWPQARSLTPCLARTQALIQHGIGVDNFDAKQEPKSV